MQVLDRLGWAMGLSIEAYGVRVGIRVSDPRTLELLPSRLPYGWKRTRHRHVDRLYSVAIHENAPGARVRRFSLLHADAARVARTMDAGELLDVLESDLRAWVAENARDRVFVHAGVVGWKGRAILLPGASYSGKTTLVSELVRAGATYYSDEYALLDARGRVFPFAQPLSVRGHGGLATRQPVESIGGRTGRRSLPVGLVVLCTWNGGRWRPRPLSPGQGALAIVAHTVAARRSPARVLQAIRGVVTGAPVLRSSRGDARETARLILERADA